MLDDAILVGGIFLLAAISGMVGLGAAFAAIPFLSLFWDDLLRQVQPVTLLLNGGTAMFAGIGFARSGYVDLRIATWLSLVIAGAMPAGAMLARIIAPAILWATYFIAVAFLLYRLYRPSATGTWRPRIGPIAAMTVPTALLAGMLGIGPGFLLVPCLLLFGFETKKAAGINALAVVPGSFLALLPHISHAQVDVGLALLVLFAGMAGAFVGARLSSMRISNARLRHVFGTMIIGMTMYKISTLIRG